MSKEEKSAKRFFDEQTGEIHTGKAICYSDDLRIVQNVRPKFSHEFIQGSYSISNDIPTIVLITRCVVCICMIAFNIILTGLQILNDAVSKGSPEKKQAFKRFVEQFGTHFLQESQLGAKIYYERRFSKKSKDVGTMNSRKDCVGKAAEGCTGGNFAIFFIKASAEACPSKTTDHCTVSSQLKLFCNNLTYKC